MTTTNSLPSHARKTDPDEIATVTGWSVSNRCAQSPWWTNQIGESVASGFQ